MPKKPTAANNEISPAVRSFIEAGRRRGVEQRANDRIDEMERVFRGEIRGLQAKCKLLEEQLSLLKGKMIKLEVNPPSQEGRKSHLQAYVSSCGKPGGAA